MSNNILKKDTEITTGTVLDKNILLSIISLATKEISGVARMDDRFRSKLKDKLCANCFEGAKVTYNKKRELEIDVYVVVYQNYNVAEIAYKIQQNIKSSLETMVDNVEKVNVHVVGVVHEDDFVEQ